MMERVIIEQLERSKKLPVAPRWLVTVVVTAGALIASIVVFNLGG